MKLPYRFQEEPGTEPVLSVDGYFGAPGLNLSHWPGNETPEDLRHDLSTGSALLFARLEPEVREERAAAASPSSTTTRTRTASARPMRSSTLSRPSSLRKS